MAEARDDIIGRRFGNYVVLRLIGKGGMGAVYEAEQPEIAKRVAIKVLAPQFSANPRIVQRFFAEARSVNLIQHENIVDIFDFGHVDGRSFLVMELLRGQSLQELFRDHVLAVPRSLDIAVQVANAMEAAHARGIIHRDLKTDNIFLVERGGRADFVKVLDFGIAKLTDPTEMRADATAFGAVLGTPGYMSPEQAAGEAVDLRTDVYALGVVLYRALSGRLPYLGPSLAELIAQQLSEPPPSLRALCPHLPTELTTLVHQMIGRKPEQRPGRMSEVAERLRAQHANLNRAGAFGPATGKPVDRIPAPAPAPPREVTPLPRRATPAIEPARRASLPIGEWSPAAERAPVAPAPARRSAVAPEREGRPAKPSAPPRSRAAWGWSALLLSAGVALGVGGAAWLRSRAAAVDGAEPPSTLATPPRPLLPAPAPAPPTAPVVETPPPTPTPKPPRRWRCRLETDPAGAEVIRNGQRIGQTPMELDDLAAQLPLLLHLRLAGFRESTIDVSRESAAILRRKLVPQPVALPPPPAGMPDDEKPAPKAARKTAPEPGRHEDGLAPVNIE